MRRRTAVLASAILAIGGFGISDPLLSVSFAQQQQQPTGQSTGQTGRTSGQGIGGQSTDTNKNATGTNKDAAGDRQGAHAGQQAELKGVQSLFAEATDAAVMRDGLQRMEALFAPENMGGAGATGASGLNHGTSTPGATGSGTTGSSATHTGAAGGTSGTSGSSSGSSGIGGTSSGTAGRTGTGAGTGATGTGTSGSGTAGANGGVGTTGGNAGLASSRDGQGNANAQQLNQLIDQFNRDWKQKYSRDFRISDPSLVFADITANDIMAGQAQPAGERLPGSGASGTSGSTSGSSTGNSGSTSGTSGASGHTSSGTTGGTSSGTSGSSGASGAAGTSGQSSSGAGRASDRTSGTSGAGFSDHGNRISSTDTRSGALSGTGAGTGAHANMMGREITVNVPPVQGSQAISVRLVRMGQDNFRFASSSGMVDQQRLASALETHIKHVLDQKDRWPTDAAQAQRLVTQHVLMAVSEASGAGGENAQPAGLHLQGHNGANDIGNTTPGSSGTSHTGAGNTSGAGDTSGSGNTGSGTSGSRTGGTSGSGGAGR
jgi:collagen type VII alpha